MSILVSDFNDNSPQFTSTDGYQFTVVEATAGLLVGSVKVIIVSTQVFFFDAGVPSYFNINSIT